MYLRGMYSVSSSVRNQ